MDKITIGMHFKALLRDLGVSKADVARTVSCSTGYLSDIEKDRKTPGADLLFALYKEYNANIHYLLSGEGQSLLRGLVATESSDECSDCERRVVVLEAKLEAYREVVRELGMGKLLTPIVKDTAVPDL